MNPINLLDLDTVALEAYLAGLGEKPYRARQVLRWVHRQGESGFSCMSDLGKSLRAKLAEVATVAPPRVVSDSTAADATRKWLLDVGEGQAVEAVFIPEDDRGTLCISTQAGCAMACTFCSTGRQGFNRNLSTAEIIGQLWLANRALRADGIVRLSPKSQCSPVAHADTLRARRSAAGVPSVLQESARQLAAPDSEAGAIDRAAADTPNTRPVTNVVLMGMGEPLLNYDNVLPALRLMLDDHAYGLSRRRVTVSTSGIVPLIDRLRDECPVALAISLHAPEDALRDRLMPINRKYPLAQLLAACRRYLEHAPRESIMFEYVLLAGVNDGPQHAKALVRLLADFPCKVNLIPFNPFPGSGFERSPPEVVRGFNEQLNAAGLTTTTRKTRGDDIDAACGQLAGRIQDRTRRVQRLQRMPA